MGAATRRERGRAEENLAMKELHCPVQLCLSFSPFQSTALTGEGAAAVSVPVLPPPPSPPGALKRHFPFLVSCQSRISGLQSKKWSGSHGISLLPHQKGPQGAFQADIPPSPGSEPPGLGPEIVFLINTAGW